MVKNNTRDFLNNKLKQINQNNTQNKETRSQYMVTEETHKKQSVYLKVKNGEKIKIIVESETPSLKNYNLSNNSEKRYSFHPSSGLNFDEMEYETYEVGMDIGKK